MSTIPAVLLQLEKPGTPILTLVKGDTAQLVFTYLTSTGNLTPSGTINGGGGSGNVTFTLPSTPANNSLQLYLRGALLTQGIEYTLTGTTITFATAPLTGSALWCTYMTPIDLTGLTSTWDLRTAPTASPLISGSGTVGGSNGVVSVTMTAAQTSGLVPTGTGSNSNTFVGTLTVKIADTNSNVKTLEKAQMNLVV